MECPKTVQNSPGIKSSFNGEECTNRRRKNLIAHSKTRFSSDLGVFTLALFLFLNRPGAPGVKPRPLRFPHFFPQPCPPHHHWQKSPCLADFSARTHGTKAVANRLRHSRPHSNAIR